MLDLKANPERAAEGAVIEAKLDKGRGPVATVLVQRGTLKVGDIVVAGAEWGRVRLLRQRSRRNASKRPARPCRWKCWAFPRAPEAGDEFVVVESEARAREVTEYRARKRREQRHATIARQTLDQLAQDRAKPARSGCCRWSSRPTCRARSKPSRARSTKLGTDEVGVQVLQGRRRRHHRKRRDPGACERGGGDRLQRPRQCPGARPRQARRRRNPLLQHHLQRRRRREGSAVRHAGAGDAREIPRQCRDPAKCSPSPRSARSPAAVSPKAWCGAAPRCA